MNVINMKVGQTVPFAQSMTTTQGKPCATPNPVDWSSSNTAVVQLLIGSTTTGAKAVAPGSAIVSLAGDGFLAESYQINVARPEDDGAVLKMLPGTPH